MAACSEVRPATRILDAMRSGLDVAGRTWAGLTRAQLGVLAVGLLLALGLRAILLPLPGLAGDQASFIAWARAIASSGLGRAYEQPLSFPPVMPWIWASLGLVDPGLRSATTDDLWTRVLMKLPATIADLGIAATVAWWFRRRPGLMVAAVLAILLAPAVIYLSAWWGQFESIYVLPALLAVVLATRGHRDVAAILAAVALMTKPQALPLVLPLAAWLMATTGWRGALRATLISGATIVALWLPFLPFGGLTAYVSSLRGYEDFQYNVISLRAWNPWWLAQLTIPEPDFVSDAVRLAGPITLRWVGVALAAILLLIIWLRIARHPTAESLLWGTAAAALGTFITLTTMHERYSYPALVFLPLLWPNRLALWTWGALLVAVTANVVAAVPPEGGPGALVPLFGPVGAIGAVAITAGAVACFVGLGRATRRDTSGGSAAASAGA